MLSLDGYTNIKLIHEGHQNLIYSATRKKDQLPVILKALRSIKPHAGEIALLYHEYEVTKDLDLPGVIKTYDLIEERNQYVLAQEDIHGISVSDYIKDHPINDLPIFFKIALQMVTILGEIHRSYIIHKDIKPGNFIIEPKGLVEKLTDFNFSAKLLHEVQDIVPPDKLEGTLAYMAPEQTGRMNMNIDYRSDFYALGVTFYELLTNKLPFTSVDSLEILHAHLASPPPDASEENSNIPRSLGKLIQKLMAKDPSDRYQSAIGIQFDLDRIAGGEIEPFELGQDDVHDRLNLSQKLYGREEEAKILLEAYEQASQGMVEALMVCGYSGIGKTMLINEVHKPMVKHSGYYISGKFDQLQRNTPYTAITQAFNQLAKHIMTESDERFKKIKNAILEVMGGVAQVIIDLAPDLERVLGKQPPLEPLPYRDAENRMMTFFKRFLTVVATKDHPLVIFIDDLQWADSGSLKILEYILNDDILGHILLIGAYRDNEVDIHHPLSQFFKEMEEKLKPIKSLPLAPLTVANFQSFFKDSFKRKEAEIYPLAQLIHKRTEGNPFFCKQIINTVYQGKMLYFDYDKHQWDWKLDEITNLNITENVVDLMLSKLSELPEETQMLLKFAACVGNRFTIDILNIISGKPSEEIGKILWPAMQKELILTLGLGYKRVDAMSDGNLTQLLSKEIIYQFIHDKVQQAVYQSISTEEKERTHLSIARTMMEKDPIGCQNEHLFLVTDHFNQAHQLLNSSEIVEVANLNYRAGMLAFGANAYKPMFNYLKAGLSLSKEDWWVNNYEIMFKLNRGYAQSLYLIADIEQAAKLSDTLLLKAQNVLDKVSIYRIQCVYFVSVGKSAISVDVAVKALELLGVKIIREPTHMDLLLKIISLKWALRGHRIETLDKEFKELTDTNIISAFEILSEIIYLVYWAPGNMYLYLSFESMLMMLRYGAPPSAGLWVTIYAMSVLHVFKNVDQTFALWELAQRLITQKNNKYTSSTAYTFRAYWINHLRYPFKEAHHYFKLGIQDALESGNLVAVAVNMSTGSSTRYCEAKSCSEIIQGNKETLEYSRKISLNDYILQTDNRIAILNGFMNPDSADNSPFESYDKLMKGKNIFHQIINTAFMSTYLFYLERYDEAYEHHLWWYKQRKRTCYSVTSYTYECVDALTISKLIPDATILKKIIYILKFRRILNDLKWAAKQCPYNYLHLYLVLKGTYEAIRGNYIKALHFFDESIENAKKGDFYLWIGTINELAGEMLYKEELLNSAVNYFQESYYFYKRFGMILKVKSLEKKYPQFFGGSFLSGNFDSNEKRESELAINTTSAALDFMSIIKASQTISSEIILEKLFEKMLHIVSENAGAEKAVFLELRKNEWSVIASMYSNQFQMHNTPIGLFQEIPQSIIRLVLHSENLIIIDDARKDSQIQSDPYITRVQPKSVICMPVLHQDKMIGLIYLENNLTVGCFTEERVTVLQTLTSQIAISLENARHFEETEILYRATERFVPKPFLKLLKKEHIEDVKLGDSVEITVTVLFTDVRDYTSITEKMTPSEAFAFINSYLKVMGPIIISHQGFINQFLGDAIMALFPRNADDAIQAIIEMSRELITYNREQETLNRPKLKVGYGLNTGVAMLGTIGDEVRMDANVISDAVNLASRIEGLNKYYGTNFLISDATFESIRDKKIYATRLVDKVRVKGKEKAVYLYEVYFDQTMSPSEQKFIETYHAAFKAYEKGVFSEALAGFLDCQRQKPNEKSSAVFVERCKLLELSPPPKEWNGTFEMTQK